MERKITLLRLGELARRVTGTFVVAHLKSIRAVLFGDLYAWAGQFRRVDIGKGQTLFCRAAFLDGEAARVEQWIRQHHYLQAGHADRFASQAGELLTHLNMLHPFREGNGRTQREFVRQLASFQGFVVDYQRMDAAAYLATAVADDSRQMAFALRPTLVHALPDRQLRQQHQPDVDRGWER